MAGLDESQAGIKIAGRNIDNLRYADDTTLMAESEEELKSFLMRVKKESEKTGLKLNVQKAKIMASSPITSWQIEEEKVETVTGFTPAALTLEANKLCGLGTLVLILQGTVVDQLSSHVGLESEHSHPGHAVGSAGLLLLSLTFGGLCLSEQWVQASVHHKTPWVVLGLLRWLSGKESTCQCRRHGFIS